MKSKASEIREHILADPEVVLEDDAVMRALIEAKAAPGGRKVVDLRGALVRRLEQRLNQLETTHRSVIAAAYENLVGVSQIHNAVLLLLEQSRFVDFLRVLTLETPDMVAVDHARLCLETDETEPGPIEEMAADLSGAMVALPPGGTDAYLALTGDAGRRVTLRRATDAADAIFGDPGRNIRSEALVRLDLGAGREGLLAFGAEDPNRFGPEHGDDLLAFFGGVVERSLKRWLDPER